MRDVMNDLPPTETADPRTAGLDMLDTSSLVTLLATSQRAAVDAVVAARCAIGEAVDAIAERIGRGGHLHYVGAGSSGRIAVLDAAEMPPTFGTPPELVRAHIAGGPAALTRAIEGAEDDGAAGDALASEVVGPDDAVVGISASGGAPFVVAAIVRARERGAYTLAITSVADCALTRAAERTIVLPTGSEALAGSTRMKAATAQKIALNVLSTALMVRLGKVHDNLMVDVVATNHKLHRRALRLVCALAKVGDARAQELLEQSGGRVKVAVVMERHGLDAPGAQALLEKHRGALRPLL